MSGDREHVDFHHVFVNLDFFFAESTLSAVVYMHIVACRPVPS
jgi:hypothetical protein